MADQVCCVDHVQPGVKFIAGRWFCDEHYAKATYKRGGVWRAGIWAVVGLVVFVAAVVAVDAVLKPNFTGMPLMLVGVVLAVVPAVLWLVFFYLQDRLEPEPVTQVTRLFIIGLALGGALGIPVMDQLFKVQEWVYRNTLTTLAGSIFIIGAVEAFVVFAAVRYFIFDAPEFDERTDGVIYATAAGLGMATALNLQFILDSGGAALGTGEIYVAEVALAQAAFGGLLGYFLGRAKLEREPLWWLASGLALTAVLNGLFNWLRGLVDTGSITIVGRQAGTTLPSPVGLIMAGALAMAVTAIVAWLINNDIARSLSDKQPAAEGDPTVGDHRSNYVALGTLAGLLVIGALVWNGTLNSTRSFAVGEFKGAYPAYFGEATGEGDVKRVVDNLGTGAEFIIREVTLDARDDLDAVLRQLTADRSTDYEAYKVMGRRTVVVGGRSAEFQQFAYADAGGLSAIPPEVIHGEDYIFVSEGRAVIVTLLASPEEIANVEPLFLRFLRSLSF